jgi:nucleotide-binding universal stress UspA family protein
VAPFSPIEDLGGLVDRAARDEEHAYLKGVDKRLTEGTAAPERSALLEVPVADSLCDYAKANGVELIVMTTHGRGPFARAWLGSVADELVRKSPIPILLARPGVKKAQLDEVPVFRRVLVPLDGSLLAEQILGPTAEFAGLMQAGLNLVRVIEPMVTGVAGETALTAASDPEVVRQLKVLHDQVKADASAYLEIVAGRLKSKGFRVETHVLVSEQPAVAILEAVKQVHADAIAISTHARSGLARLFLGSVADKVLRAASIPILIHRPGSAEVTEGSKQS